MMLKEITLKEAIKLMEEGAPVYGVNLENEDKQLVDLRHLFTGVRILADIPETKKPQGGGKGKARPP